MILTTGKILIEFIETPQTIIINTKDANNKVGDFFIRQVSPDLTHFQAHIGKKIHMREHFYKLGVSNKEQIKEKKYFFIIDYSEIWGLEE
jgi:hypothetical protein